MSAAISAATLNVRSICAALITASRPFHTAPASKYQLVHPLWTEPNCSRMSLRTARRQAFAQAQEPFEPELTVLKEEVHLVPICAHSHMANFRGRSVEPDQRTVDVTEAREHGQPEHEFAVLAVKQFDGRIPPFSSPYRRAARSEDKQTTMPAPPGLTNSFSTSGLTPNRSFMPIALFSHLE